MNNIYVAQRLEVLDTIMRKSGTLRFNEEAMDATIQRKLVKDIKTSNQVVVGLNAFHPCNNHQTTLEWLKIKVHTL